MRERQMKLADGIVRRATVEAVTAYRDRQTAPKPRRMAEMMLKRVTAMQQSEIDGTAPDTAPIMTELSGEILAARRVAVVKAHNKRKQNDKNMREVLEHMDFEEAAMAGRGA